MKPELVQTLQKEYQIDLELEAKNLSVSEWLNGRGIQWDFKLNEDGTFERLECGLDESDNVFLRVSMLTEYAFPDFREPTIDEVFKFAIVASHVYPESEYTKNLQVACLDMLQDKEKELTLMREHIMALTTDSTSD